MHFTATLVFVFAFSAALVSAAPLPHPVSPLEARADTSNREDNGITTYNSHGSGVTVCYPRH
jgi:hypothetical protein